MIFFDQIFRGVKRFFFVFRLSDDARRSWNVEGADERGGQSDFVKNNFLFFTLLTPIMKLAVGNFLFTKVKNTKYILKIKINFICWAHFGFFLENFDFGGKSGFLHKILTFHQHFDSWPKFWFVEFQFLAKISLRKFWIFEQNFGVKLAFFTKIWTTKILICKMNFNFWTKFRGTFIFQNICFKKMFHNITTDSRNNGLLEK